MPSSPPCLWCLPVSDTQWNLWAIHWMNERINGFPCCPPYQWPIFCFQAPLGNTMAVTTHSTQNWPPSLEFILPKFVWPFATAPASCCHPLPVGSRGPWNKNIYRPSLLTPCFALVHSVFCTLFSRMCHKDPSCKFGNVAWQGYFVLYHRRKEAGGGGREGIWETKHEHRGGKGR